MVLLYGGSFDPPHAYHLHAPSVAARANGSQRLPCVYVPASRSPFKDAGPVASDAQRVAMLRAMLRGRRSVCVWTDEIDRAAWQRQRGVSKPSFSIETVRRLREQLGKSVRVRLIIGADQAVAFHRWRSARTLIRVAEPVVMPREGVADGATLVRDIRRNAGGFWREKELDAWRGRIASGEVVRVSSTRVREELGSSGRRAALRSLPRGVAGIIKSTGLYTQCDR